jgi:hypothetical protein
VRRHYAAVALSSLATSTFTNPQLAQLHVGSVRGLVYAHELEAPSSSASTTSSSSNAYALRAASVSTLPPPPRFAGFDAQERPLTYTAAPAAAPTSGGARSPSAHAGKGAATGQPLSSLAPPGAGPNAAAGVRWIDEAGTERVTTARLVVVADGYYSTLRNAVSKTPQRMVTASYFCGLILHHEAPGSALLPYPNRGHVVMADPNPVLLYQVRAREWWCARCRSKSSRPITPSRL